MTMTVTDPHLVSAELLSPFLPLCIHPPFLSDVVFVHGNYQQQVNEYISRQAGMHNIHIGRQQTHEFTSKIA